MAVPTYHITDADSGVYGTNAFGSTGPGTLLMDADAWLVSPGSTLVFFDPLTATINGKITSSNFSGGGNAGIYVNNFNPGRTSITVGTTGEVTGYWGILADTQQPTDIVNKGRIVSFGASGSAINETFVAGDYSINNSGSIIASFHAIDLDKGASGATHGIHTIINSGIIDAPTAIFSSASVIEKVTNSGTIHGDVFLGASSDVFTDFIKIVKHGKTIIHHGSVDGVIDLGTENDIFKGGNNAETVKDGGGGDTYKLSGGNDTLIAAHDTGVDGVDTIDGGAGRDTYDASAYDGGAPLQINLDAISHGGVAANSVLVNGQGDHIFNFEDVIGSAGSDIIYGNAAANHLVGNPNTGSAGADQLFGFGGNDVLETNHNGSQLFGGDGNDILTAGGNSILEGGNGNDVLSVSLGFSDLYGGAGRDILTGGDFEGAGTIQHLFRYKALSDSGVTASTRDEITNFHLGGTPGGSGDFIDISAIDAIPATKGVDDDFTFIGANPWGHHAGELRYLFTATQTIVEADVNGDAKADFSIALDGHLNLAATDFIL